MSYQPYDAIPSKAAIAGHPIHPMLIALPIGSFVGALLTDVGFWVSGDPFWARASLWLVGAGLVSGAFAGVFGFTDFVTTPAIRQFSAAWVHLIGNLFALAVAFASLLFRVSDPVGAVIPLGIALSLITDGILVVTGWMGGELSYRHRVGVSPHEHMTSATTGEPISIDHHRAA
jgi:uncharacterized membrane protein